MTSSLEKIRILETKIELYEKLDWVKEYIMLKKRLEEANINYENELFNSKVDECSKCDHLIVSFSEDFNDFDRSKSYEYGCLKCGINTYIYNNEKTLDLSLEEKAILAYMKKSKMIPRYRNTNIYFNNHIEFEKACKLYTYFKERNKDASDEMIIKMIEESISSEKEIKKLKAIVKNNV